MTRLKISALTAACSLVIYGPSCPGVFAQPAETQEIKETNETNELKTLRAGKPLQGYATVDSKGTPVVPPWKIEAGEDAFVGKFYVGVVGVKLMAVDGPPPAAVLTGKQLAKWRGKKPFPCVIRFTKLTDDSGGYYFQSVGFKDGPQGWIMPLKKEAETADASSHDHVKKEKKEKKTWSLYFRQQQKTD